MSKMFCLKVSWAAKGLNLAVVVVLGLAEIWGD